MNHIDLKNKTIFVTGSAGFIGSNLVLELLKTQSPINIIGLDNMNDYYDVNIKEWRLQEMICAISTIRYAPHLSAISRKRGKSMVLA